MTHKCHIVSLEITNYTSWLECQTTGIVSTENKLAVLGTLCKTNIMLCSFSVTHCVHLQVTGDLYLIVSMDTSQLYFFQEWDFTSLRRRVKEDALYE